MRLLLDKFQGAHPYKPVIIGLVILSLVLMFISFELALKASASFAKSSSEEAGIEKGLRFFFNSNDTLSKFEKLDNLKESMRSPKYPELIDCGCAELWVAYVLQSNRYHKLKNSMKALRAAILLLIVAVCIAFLRV